MVANILNDFSRPWDITWEFPIFNFLTYHITQNSSEIFMSGEGEETSGIGEHSHKFTYQTHAG